jgi:hypothetical protein
VLQKPYTIKNRHKPEEETIHGYPGPLICRTCNVEKERSEFYVSSLARNERKCKACCKKYNREKLKDVNFLIDHIYNKQAYTCRRKDRKSTKLRYTREELLKWVNGQKRFFELYRVWLESDLHALLRPTICRKDVNADFTLDNLRIVTVKESKSVLPKNQMRPIGQFTVSGNLVTRYPGIQFAARDLKGSVRHIMSSLQQKEKTYRGYIWRYLDETKK